jgi:hypothetical protein
MNISNIFRKSIIPFRGRKISGFYPIKTGYKLLIAFLNPIEVQGHKMFIGLDNELELLTNPYLEKFKVGLLKKSLKEEVLS